MDTPKCPACRRRFPDDSESTVCTRCGADLALLIRLRRHARKRVVEALSNPSSDPAATRAQLREAQRICFSPEVRQLLVAMEEGAE